MVAVIHNSRMKDDTRLTVVKKGGDYRRSESHGRESI